MPEFKKANGTDPTTAIIVSLDTPGRIHAKNLTEESARVASELLQENHEKYHIYFTSEELRGVFLHNHIAHHSLTLWALGASPKQLRSHHVRNTSYQKDQFTPQASIVKDLQDPKVWKRCIGKEVHFKNFEEFFQNKIREVGVSTVLQRYLVGKSDIATDLLCRSYHGFGHGLIHIGLGLEFKQPLVLAEGLAQACVHNEPFWTDFLLSCETEASKATVPAMSLSDCIDACRADPVISTCASFSYQRQFRPISGEYCLDRDPIKEAVLGLAGNEMHALAIQYRVDPNNLERATAELINAAVYLAAGAQRPPHECRFDFFLLHTVTASMGHSTFLDEPSISKYQKSRLLEFTGRAMLVLYASLGSPEPRLDWVDAQPSQMPNQTWETIFARACDHEDDGHMSKLIRSLRNAQKVSEKYDGEQDFRVKQKTFFKAAEAALDGVSKVPITSAAHLDFIRGAGWEEAWTDVPVLRSPSSL